MPHGTSPVISDSANAIVERDDCPISAPIRAVQFVSRSRRLFGVMDEPPAGHYCGRSVVLCYPQGPDYASAFRTFRVLATRLRNAGCRVLRFDYFGTGDSDGDLRDASIEQWIADIGAAVREMHLLGATDVSLAGLRLGATLAALAACELESVTRLALWEPVLEGAPYLSCLRAMHESWMREEKRNGRVAACTENEVFGDHLSAALRDQLAEISLWSVSSALPSVQLVWQCEETHHEHFASFLRERGARVTATRSDGSSIWSRSPVMPEPPVPNKALQSIISFLTA